MEKNKSVVEETLLQIRAVEEAISENAKGILASTMKEEISQLVKESLNQRKRLHEQDAEAPVDGEEEEVDVEYDSEDDESEEDINSEEGVEEPEMPQAGVDGDNVGGEELPPLDMTQASPEEVLRVFKAMGDQDGIIVKKQDDGDVHLVDNNSNTEYLITFGGESQPAQQTNMMENYMENNEMDGTNYEGTVYELEVEGDEMGSPYEEFTEGDEMGSHYGGYEEETVFEIDQEELESVLEAFKYSKKPNMDKVSYKMKEGPKRHGKGGNFKKDPYPSKMKHGVTETPEDELGEEWMTDEEIGDVVGMDGEAETMEAARTLGNGKYWGRKGLPKVRTAPRHLKVESVDKELNLLREKNEEYKKALDFFRNKLNEVAVFNSNLAYSTRLFTEHSTTKQEKINILRRFDNVESLKESKNLYKSIKEELGDNKTNESINESVQRKVIKTPQNGSSSNLIESKTYENPQFLRMKDLMSKIK